VLRRPRTPVALATVAVLLLPAATDAKTYRAKLHVQGVADGAALRVTVSGAPLGRCRGTGEIGRDGTTYALRCRGGTVRMRSKASTGLADRSRGRWRMLGGTGRFRHINGSGRFAGRLSTGAFVCTGTVRF